MDAKLEKDIKTFLESLLERNLCDSFDYYRPGGDITNLLERIEEGE